VQYRHAQLAIQLWQRTPIFADPRRQRTSLRAISSDR
jgi:hypothetical protein